jgi:hypothetical protein
MAPQKPDDTTDKFLRSIESLRNLFSDLYSSEALNAIHELLKDHYQPRQLLHESGTVLG